MKVCKIIRTFVENKTTMKTIKSIWNAVIVIIAFFCAVIVSFFLGKLIGSFFPAVSDTCYWAITFATMASTMFIFTYAIIRIQSKYIK